MRNERSTASALSALDAALARNELDEREEPRSRAASYEEVEPSGQQAFLFF